jgi:23S rRNA (cytidine1920-2'-O)/16S rRNA (cytidine1409-2'-O)-methyltransferase
MDRPGAPSPRAGKIRLDQLLVDRALVESRQRARSLIMAGKVHVGGNPIDKPGTRVPGDSQVSLQGQDHPFVSRGGVKLAAALQCVPLGVAGRICLDVGASTGGFTDCLLQNGARRVYAVDVGYGQLAWKLRQDPRVTVIERANIRYLPAEAVGEPVDLAVIDTSFISLRLVVPAVLRFLRPGGRILALIKPQFEVGRGQVGKGGVVRQASLHQAVIADLSAFFTDCGLTVEKVLPSPILGPKGNREFIIALLFSS